MLFPTLALATALCAALALPAAAAPRAAFYVSPKGNDEWSGRLPAVEAGRTDGPFATLERARAAVRDELKRPGDGPVVVLLRGGVYSLEAPVGFGPEDSGTAERPVVYAAYPGEKPVLSGGRRLTGWRAEPSLWRLSLPDVAAGRWNFMQLWVDGKRCYRPRLPGSGYYTFDADSTATPGPAGSGFDEVYVKAGDVRTEWANFDDVELLGFQIWTMARMRIKSVDTASGKVTLTGRTAANQYWSSLPRGNRFLVENVREALGVPGTFYLDRRAGELLYVPRPGERHNRAEVVAPVLPYLLALNGDPAGRRWVSHVTFRGLTFAHTNWVTPPQGNSFPQAEANLGAAIRVQGARDVAWEGCRIAHVGEYAIDLGAGCKRCRIEDCEVTDIGAGGIKVGETAIREDDELVASHNTLTNNLVAHGGRLHPAAIGVWIGQSHHNTLRNNEIADFYYTGISVGWTWGYGPSLAHHNVFEHNRIHHLGQGVLSDMGGTYSLGVSPGSVQRGNVIHDVYSYSYGGWGIYFDEGTTGMLAENNLVYRCRSATFHQHYGKENVLRNNIWALGREHQLMRTRVEPHLSFTFERNLVYWTEGVLLGSNWSGDNYKLASNLYWQADREPFNFAGQSWEEWRARGQDAGSYIEDPLFVNPARSDFRLKPGSPAEKVGFVPFDFTLAGRRANGKPVREVALAPPAFPQPPPPGAPTPIAEDFESTRVGQTAVGATTHEEDPRYTARVTDETAVSGSRSLKFTDGPGQKAEYNPHVFWDPSLTSGTVTGQFHLKLGDGAPLLYHEWRDADSPYRVGPSVWVHPDGTLKVRERVLAQLPPGQWVRLTVKCALGDKANGTWSLEVRMPGRTAPLRFSGLPCDPEFRVLRWYGITSNGAAAATFYVDDVSLKAGR